MTKSLLKVKKTKVYFTKDTEDAIIQYNKSADKEEREALYRQRIQAPLDKLAENVINRFKFPYMEGSFDDIKSQVVSFLVINLHKFTENKGKAFSYFSVIAKNYLILHNNNAYRDEKRSLYISDPVDNALLLEEILIVESDESSSQTDMREFLFLLVDYWDFRVDSVFKKKRDIEIANAVVDLLRRVDNIDNFNKKALYLMMREMTGHKTTHITKVINKMRKYVLEELTEYRKNGQLSNPASTYFSYKK